MLDFLLDILFPKHCISCGKFGQFICNSCLSKIEFFNDQVCPYCERPSPYGFPHPRCAKPHGLDGMFVMAHYRGSIREAIREVKYHGTYGLISELVNLLISKYHHQYNFDYLIPIPLHPSRERERGFNQAEKLAKQLSVMLACPASLGVRDSGVADAPLNDKLHLVNLLVRTRATKPQFGLKYDERKNNVRDAFGLNHQYPVSSIQQTSFCLVDDVSTTGSTIFECAKVLKRAGAKKVWAICVARGG